MSERLRDLLDDPRKEVVTLNDVVRAYIRCAEKVRFLEFRNTAHSLREAKRVLQQARKVAADFEIRIKNEVTNDVTKELAKIDKRIDPARPEKNIEFLGD